MSCQVMSLPQALSEVDGLYNLFDGPKAQLIPALGNAQRIG